MRGYWDNCLTVGNNVNLGQLYDMRSNGISTQRIEYQRESYDQEEKSEDFRLISRINTDNQIPQVLKVSKQFFLREICYSTSNFNDFLDFLLPTASNYILLRFENITQTIHIKNVQQNQNFTHVISKIDYGSIIFIRIVPYNEDINIDELYQTLQSGAKHNAMLEKCCDIQSFANWETKKSYNTINEAINEAKIQLEKKNYCKVRYCLSPITVKPIWQQDDEATMSALQKLFRLQMTSNVLKTMLHRLNVSTEIDTFEMVALEERVVEKLNSHLFFKLNTSKQDEFIAIIFDLFTKIHNLKLACLEYMRKRYTSFLEPMNPSITHILDTFSFGIIQLCIRIFNTFDETFIEERKGSGIVYFTLNTKSQETFIFHSSTNFILINGEANFHLIDTFKQMPKYYLNEHQNFLLAYLASGKPQTIYWQKEFLKFENEKAVLHIFPSRNYFGIAKPLEFVVGKPASLSQGKNLSSFQCRCQSREWRIWICYVCDEILTAESGGKSCCKCGKHDVSKLSLKCFNKWHGTEFIEQKSGGVLQTLVTTVFGCGSLGGQRYESIEMGHELYELKEIKNNSNSYISQPSSPSTININVDVKPKAKMETNVPSIRSTASQAKETSLPKLPSETETHKHSYNLRSSVSKEEQKKNQETVTSNVKQRSLINSVDKFLVAPTTTLKTDIKLTNARQSSSTVVVTIKENSNASVAKNITTIKKSTTNKKINIAIIGESGVGKSTLLNAISNYLKFDSAKDAFEKDSLEYIIPCQFKVFYSDFSEKLVSIGMPDENERYQEEATVLSTTQECKEYSFEFNGFKINFIDTPGLSDTAGIEKDAKNLEKIRSFICSSLDSLHAICFVLKANEARMDLGFSNSMNDLLSIFPKSALLKVIFFMTHSRGTLYGPGDSMTPLKNVSEKLSKIKGVTFPLTNENIFCVDNESFLFLCAKNQGIEYSGATFEDFESSWKKSKLATQRFFNKVTTFKPVSVRNIKFLKDLENVLTEQKAILSTRATPERWFYHFLTAKTMEFIEVGNIGQKYLDLINMDLIQREANYMKNMDLKKLEIKETIAGIPEFLKTSKTTPMPQTIKFVQNHLSDPNNI